MINIDGTLFIFHGYYFEQLLKYDEHVNNQATAVLSSIKGKGLIGNAVIWMFTLIATKILGKNYIA